MAANEREFEGKGLEEALKAASASLGIAEPDLDYKIIEQGRRGLFGLGARSVRIRVMPPLARVDEQPQPRESDGRPPRRPAGQKAAGQTGSDRRGPRGEPRGKRGGKPRTGQRGEEPGKGGGRQAGGQRGEEPARGRGKERGGRRGEEPPKNRGRGRGRGRRGERRSGRRAELPREEPRANAEPPTADDVQSVETTVQRMVDLLQFELKVQATGDDAGVNLKFDGSDLDVLSQKEGELANAMQFLLNRMARRKWPKIGRIELEDDGQRQRRDEELTALTHEVAQQVGQTGKAKQLHEMNGYERRLVHLTVREYDGLGSRSEGNGYLKRVRIFKQGERKG